MLVEYNVVMYHGLTLGKKVFIAALPFVLVNILKRFFNFGEQPTPDPHFPGTGLGATRLVMPSSAQYNWSKVEFSGSARAGMLGGGPLKEMET